MPKPLATGKVRIDTAREESRLRRITFVLQSSGRWNVVRERRKNGETIGGLRGLTECIEVITDFCDDDGYPRPHELSDEDEIFTCRVCGCTENTPCGGGCCWVADPELLGELCSACLPEVESRVNPKKDRKKGRRK